MSKKHGLGKNTLVREEEPDTQMLSVVRKTEPLLLKDLLVLNKEPERSPEDVLLTDSMIRLAIVTLLRGKSFAATRFPIHSGLVSLLCKDLKQGAEVLFLEHLERYFTQAHRHVSQVPNKEQADQILDQVRQYIKQYGLPLVGKVILARMAAF